MSVQSIIFTFADSRDGFDGDYMTTTVAIGPFDPLPRAVDAMVANFVQNPWLTRRLGKSLRSIGFTVTSVRSHGYTQTTEPQYMLTIIDRGADVLAGAENVGAEQAMLLGAEVLARWLKGLEKAL